MHTVHTIFEVTNSQVLTSYYNYIFPQAARVTLTDIISMFSKLLYGTANKLKQKGPTRL